MNALLPLLLTCLLMTFPLMAGADSFRCGTRIVVTGDSVSRLVGACGQPSEKYKARESLKTSGGRKTAAVTQWVYPRGRKKDMIVSVLSGRVVKIAVD